MNEQILWTSVWFGSIENIIIFTVIRTDEIDPPYHCKWMRKYCKLIKGRIGNIIYDSLPINAKDILIAGPITSKILCISE